MKAGGDATCCIITSSIKYKVIHYPNPFSGMLVNYSIFQVDRIIDCYRQGDENSNSAIIQEGEILAYMFLYLFNKFLHTKEIKCW